MARRSAVLALLGLCACAGRAGADGTHKIAGEASARSGDLVDITTIAPGVVVDMRYASNRNFTHKRIYPVARCLLRRAVARRLARVEARLQKRGLGLKLWDCYRPISVQQRFWKLVPDPRYVARPVVRNGKLVSGSKHNRGAAVDLTLVDAHGRELEMPTDHDNFSGKAHADYAGGTARSRSNRAVLRHAMEAEGFTALATEWWHFDGPGWRHYALSNQPLK